MLNGWRMTDTSGFPVFAVTRAYGSSEEQPESTNSAITLDIDRFELMECCSVAVTLNTSSALVTGYRLYMSNLVIRSRQIGRSPDQVFCQMRLRFCS